ncbi:DUF6906 family protein [Clostridium magnum]|uniref:DUF6906 domain-containing protein n=1 Tax=Clostridium magnum DSM 2767 TaxID=1121326 RepID=A0A161X472_9CLOT|nr:hypothetical protein [Clostridium magnum]KZL94328.1 hypothetical protein CLMAG_13810 [Clostridium magnum DSM 2767]SHJ54841.1 hypothetical protein SAMN02745944_06140 [Clostridium magnum DSM 2767]
MKRPRRLTRAEKILLTKEGHNPKYFLRLMRTAEYYEFIEVSSGKILTLRR